MTVFCAVRSLAVLGRCATCGPRRTRSARDATQRNASPGIRITRIREPVSMAERLIPEGSGLNGEPGVSYLVQADGTTWRSPPVPR
jgi:hypothetical protein